MKENIAISKKRQKSFETSVENYKKKLKTGEIKIKDKVPRKKITNRTPRGIVYLSNIPHGFYEEEMEHYFQQFGAVTRLRLARSKNTGKSKGYAFIEFKVPDVAEIVAETMNNYLMYKRLVKAKYIPPEEQDKYYFKGNNWTEATYPKLKHREANIRRENAKKEDNQVLQTAKKLLKGVDKIKKKLLEVGIIYNFEPIDIPDELKSNKTEKTVENVTTESDDSESEIELENDGPTLFLHESDDSDIVFNAPPDVKTVIVPKSKPDRKENLKTKKLKANVTKTADKKLTGISKKTKLTKTKELLEKDSKKMKLIQKNILDGNQMNLRSMKEIKKKKIVKK